MVITPSSQKGPDKTGTLKKEDFLVGVAFLDLSLHYFAPSAGSTRTFPHW